jgi:hypothetical protein
MTKAGFFQLEMELQSLLIKYKRGCWEHSYIMEDRIKYIFSCIEEKIKSEGQ